MNIRETRGGTAATVVGLLALIVGVVILFYLLSGPLGSYTQSHKPETVEQKQEKAARQAEDIVTPGLTGVMAPPTESPQPHIAKPKIPTSIRASTDELEQP